jgi:hypothetical protein
MDSVHLAESNSELPFVVIEYFHPSTNNNKIVDSKWGITKQESHAGRLKKCYKEESDSFTQSKIDIPPNDNRVHKERWSIVDQIVVIEPSLVQIYFSYSLNHPHYSVSPLEYPSYILTFGSSKGKTRCIRCYIFVTPPRIMTSRGVCLS